MAKKLYRENVLCRSLAEFVKDEPLDCLHRHGLAGDHCGETAVVCSRDSASYWRRGWDSIRHKKVHA